MDILSEIIEVSNQIIDTLEENDFFIENPFIDAKPLKRALQIMLDRDYINELSREQMKTKFGTTQKAYMVTNSKILMDAG